MKTVPPGLFVERGGGGPAAFTLSCLGSGGLIGVEGMLLGSPRESDGRRTRDVGVEGAFAAEGDGEGELDELEARETERGIASRVGMFWGADIDDCLGCWARSSSSR